MEYQQCVFYGKKIAQLLGWNTALAGIIYDVQHMKMALMQFVNN